MTDPVNKAPEALGIPAAAVISPLSSAHSARESIPLFGPDEPPPFVVVNGESKAPYLIVCDHASNRIPASLDQLGLPEEAMERHIAWDIGAGAVTRLLADRLGAKAVLVNYSRLVVDCNRNPADETAIRAVSDFQEVPGNRDLSDAERAQRTDQIFWPYHNAVRIELARTAAASGVSAPALISIHSFTPVFQGFERPWQMGVLWDQDPRIARPLMAAFNEIGVVVGDNEPYSGKHPHDFTVDHHAESVGLPYVSMEIRQDLIGDQVGQAHCARLIHKCISPILTEKGLYRKFDPTTCAER